MAYKKIPVVFIVGPTACGKTALSIMLAKYFDAEIVSADSMQIYEGMDIATAKPTLEEMSGIKHHLIGTVSTDHRFSVAEYLKIARNCIEDINSRGKKVLVVGGTGLYVRSLVENIIFEDEEESTLRNELYKIAQENSNKYMLEILRKLDPEYAEKLSENNLSRIIRAIEINKKFNHTMKEHFELSRKESAIYDSIIIGLNYKNREKLYDCINKRVDLMLEKGLVSECEHFFGKLNHEDTAVQAIGYKELFPYLEGEISLQEATENLKQATRNFAKRQLTWFKKDEQINWFYKDEITQEELFKQTKDLLNDFFKA